MDQTNLYANQHNKNLGFTYEEIQAFLGVLIIMGFNSLPQMRKYWSQSHNFHNKRITSIFPLKRFLNVLRFLHVNGYARKNIFKMPKPQTSFTPVTQPASIRTVVGSGENTGLDSSLSPEEEQALSIIPTLSEGIPVIAAPLTNPPQTLTNPSWLELMEREGSSQSVPEVDLEDVDESYKVLVEYARSNNLGSKIIRDYSKNTGYIDRGLFNITLYEYLSKEISESQALGMLKGIRMERQRAQAQSSRDTEHAMQKFITEQEGFLTMALDKLRQREKLQACAETNNGHSKSTREAKIRFNIDPKVIIPYILRVH